MTREEYLRTYWKMYEAIEQDYRIICRYVEMDLGDNYLYSDEEKNDINYGNSRTYSIEFVKQYEMICSAVEDILKVICKEEDGKILDRMNKYAESILSNDYYKNVANQKVMLGQMELQPFINWSIDEKRHIYWWTDYGELKHNMIKEISRANLKNTLNALAGLYILNMYLVKRISDNYCFRSHGNLVFNEDDNSLEQMDVPIDRSKLFEMNNWDTRVISTGYNQYSIC